MKLTAIAIGTRGDVQPMMELGKEMRRRGHDFRIATYEKFHPLADAIGVPYIHLDGEADLLMQLLVTDYKTSKDFMLGCIKLFRATPNIIDQMEDAVRGSDFVIYTFLAGFARHACDFYGIPCARVFYSPFDATEQYSLYTNERNSPKVAKTYQMQTPGMNLLTMLLANKWKRAHGQKKWTLRDDYRLQNGKPVLTFYPVSPLMMPPDPHWGAHIHVPGYFFHPQENAAAAVPDPALEAFLAAGSAIFVGFGKAQSPDLLELQKRTIAALRETGIRAVVQIDNHISPEMNDNLFFLKKDLPYSWLFPRVTAVVHHGGNTTNGLGLLAGKPTLVIALALDQYFYGRQINEIGCGPAPLYVRKKLPTVEAIKASLLDLTNGRYDSAAQAAAEKLKNENGCQAAAEIIERWM